MNEIERLKKAILEEYPRLNEESEFCFKCHKDVPCFNACCGDVNIFLTPYDIIRLKNRLGITSTEFLSKYTISPFDENAKYPVLLLKMEDNEKKSCPFVSDEGCTVYEDRPWPCRMYPLGLASPKENQKGDDAEFYFLLKEATCYGHKEDNKLTVRGWLENQGIEEYNVYGDLFKDVTLHDFFEKGNTLDPKKMEMFFTACYNVDKFRSFVFNSTFLQKFDVDEDTVARIKDDDVEMLKFAYEWIKFAIFGEKTMKIRTDAIDSTRKHLSENYDDLVPQAKWIAAWQGLTSKERAYANNNTDWTAAKLNPSGKELSILIMRLFAEGLPKKKVADELINRGIEKDAALAHIRLLEVNLK